MARNKGWFRLYNRMIDSPQVLELDDSEFRLLISIWCLVSEAGQDGKLLYSIQAIRRRVMPDKSVEEIQQMIEHLKQLDLLSGEDGNYEIPRWGIHQYEYPSKIPKNRKDIKDKKNNGKCTGSEREINGKQTRSKREVNVKIDTETDTETDTEKDIKDPPPPAPVGDDKQHDEDCDEGHDEGAKPGSKPGSKSGSADYSSDFLAFWAAYPRKREKRGAFRVWKARLREQVKPAALIAAAKNYAAAMKGKDAKFIKLPTTFLGPDKPYEEWVEGIPDEYKSKPEETTDYYEKVYLT